MSLATAPTWVHPDVTALAIADTMGRVGQLRATTGHPRYGAMVEAMSWAMGWSPAAPMSGVRWPAKAGSVRVESDAGLLVAHYHHAPTVGQWDWLGHPMVPVHAPGDTAEWGYGVWRVLGWLLGDVVAAPPTDDVTRWPSALPGAEQTEVAAAARTRWGNSR